MTSVKNYGSTVKNGNNKTSNLREGYIAQDSPTTVDEIPLAAEQLVNVFEICGGVFRKMREFGMKTGDIRDFHFISIYPIDAFDVETIEGRLKTTYHAMCREYGVSYSVANTDAYLVLVDQTIKNAISKDDPDVALKLHLAMLQAVMSGGDGKKDLTVQDAQHIIQHFPHRNREVLLYYDEEGNKRPHAPNHLPETGYLALCGHRVEEVSLVKKLAWLHFCVLMYKDTKLRTTVSHAMTTLEVARQSRLALRDSGVRSKKYMTPRVGLDNTMWKFSPREKIDGEYVMVNYDFVVHPGSGPVDRLSRYAFGNSLVICIDPIASDGDYVMSFEDYKEMDVPLPPGRGLMCSDIAVHYNGRGGLAPKGTNEAAASCIKFALDNNLDYIVKVAMDVDENLPAIFFQPIYSLYRKVRLHNLEFIVARGDKTLSEIFHWGAPIVKHANDYREYMNETREFPDGIFKMLDPVIGLTPKFVPVVLGPIPVRSITNDHFIPKMWDNDKMVKLRGALVGDFKNGFIDHTQYHGVNCHGLTAKEFTSLLIERCKWLTIRDALVIVANRAVEYGYSDDDLMCDVVFEA